MKTFQAKNNKKILLLLWHPEGAAAGGYVRIKEFLPYFKDIQITVLDNKPTIFEKHYRNANIIEYSIPKWIKRTYSIHFTLGRILEWTYTFFVFLYLGLREFWSYSYAIIYSPTGELPHIFLACVLLKLLTGKKLLLDILNFEVRGTTWWSYFRAIFNRKRGLFQNRSLVYAISMLVHLLLQHRLIHFADAIVTVSPYMRDVLSKYVPRKAIAVTQSGVVIPEKQAPVQNYKYDGIYVGRHTPEKGVFDLIKVWKLVVEKKHDAKLLLVGFCDDDIKAQLEKDIIKLQLQTNVTLTGIVPESEKLVYLQSSCMFLHLAHYEPLVPVITILEALAYGKPVITYEVDSLYDYPYLFRQSSLIIIERHNIQKAADEVLRLLSLSSSEREKLYKNARELAKIFSWPEIARVELRVMEKLLL